MRQGLLVVCVLSLSLSCGKKKKDDNTPVTDDGGPATVSSDTETSAALVSAQLDETTSALNVGDASTTASNTAALRQPSALIDGVTKTRECTADSSGKGALVKLTYSGNGGFTAGKVTVTESAGGTETRDWTNSDNSVVCTASGKYAKINWALVKGSGGTGAASGVNNLKLVDTTQRSRTLATTLTSKSGDTKTRSVATTETGTRTVSWSVASTSATTTTTKTIASSVTKTYSLIKFNGTTVNLDAVHATDANAPLQVSVERDSSGVPRKHTINKGTMTISKTGKYYITNSYSDVVFDLTGSDPCTPVSGTLTSSFYKSNSTADMAVPVKTVVTTFAASGPSVAGDDTAADDLVASINHNCDFKAGD